MSLIKWFRKNNTKIMAIVVIVLMFGFIGGSYLSYIARRTSPMHQTVAYYLDDQKITNYDLHLAQQQLEILQSLRADDLLRAQDLKGILLAEVLFASQRPSPILANQIRQIITRNRYRISDQQISELYERRMPPTVYWLLLKKEAQLAGIRIPHREIGAFLSQAIPRLFGGLTYQQFINSLVQRGTSERQVLGTFADLMAVLKYVHFICDNENLTTTELLNVGLWQNESIDVDFVRFAPARFADPNNEPNEQQITAHFERYKQYFPGQVSDQNPYGFGYKLPELVRLEYIAVKLDEVASITPEPTDDEMEQYYQKNQDLFTEQIRSDPNDPNSPLTTRIKSYAEVLPTISQWLRNQKINAKAQQILQEAEALTQAQLDAAGAEIEKLTDEELKKLAGDYKAAAEQLRQKYKISVHYGKTGLLSAEQMQSDKYLGPLAIPGYNNYPVQLTRLVFAVDTLGLNPLGPADAPKPRLFENLGPAKNFSAQMLPDTSGQIMVLLRIIEARKATVPESLDVSFATHSLLLDPNEDKPQPYSVKQRVIEDLKNLAAMETAKARASEFLRTAKADGWEKALERLNAEYSASASAQEPNAFKIEHITGVQRIGADRISVLKVQNKGNPTARTVLYGAAIDQQFAEQLFAMLSQKDTDPNVQDKLVVFEPRMVVLCIKNLSLNRFYKEDFEATKPAMAFRLDDSEAQNAAAVHLNPENILKRTRFRMVEQTKDTSKTKQNPAKKEQSS